MYYSLKILTYFSVYKPVSDVVAIAFNASYSVIEDGGVEDFKNALQSALATHSDFDGSSLHVEISQGLYHNI